MILSVRKTGGGGCLPLNKYLDWIGWGGQEPFTDYIALQEIHFFIYLLTTRNIFFSFILFEYIQRINVKKTTQNGFGKPSVGVSTKILERKYKIKK